MIFRLLIFVAFQTARMIMEMTSKQTDKAEQPSSSSKEVQNISHLVKRKRKSEDNPDDTNEAQPAKKPIT